MVLAGSGVFWMTLGGSGWLWVIPLFGNSEKIYNLDIFALAETHAESKQEICLKIRFTFQTTTKCKKDQ